jgi:hypothetical protein
VLLDDALKNLDARRVLDKLVGRRVSNPDGGLNSLTLSGAMVPAFGPDRKEGQADAAWDALQAFAEAELIEIQPGRGKPGYAPYEVSPKVRLIPDAFERACALLGRETRKFSRSALWRAALEREFPGETTLHEALAGNWLEVECMTSDAVAWRLKALRDLKTGDRYPNYPLRHISAKYFMGDSKVLDGREDLICKVLGVTECPFPESPVQMQVRLPSGDVEGILLVENAVSFEQLAANTVFPGTEGLAIVQAHGFKGAAKRIRRRGGCSLYFAPSSIEVQARFESIWFDDRVPVKVFFWGDLDFSGMGILKALRSVFPQAVCWQPGYASLLSILERDDAHPPKQAGKSGQIHPGEVGCPYADTVLIPAMESQGRFVDQEAVLF